MNNSNLFARIAEQQIIKKSGKSEWKRMEEERQEERGHNKNSQKEK